MGCLWSHSCAFWQKLYKTKVAGHPWFSGSGSLFGPQIWIWKNLGPMSWRHGQSLWRLVDKTNVVVFVLNSYLVRLDTLYPDPGTKGGRWGSGASAVHFDKNFIKQKLLRTPNTAWVGHFLGCQIQIWKDLGTVCFWSCGASLSRRVYKTKSCSVGSK